MRKYKIVIIGSGNVAYHLIRSITGAGHKIVQIYNRTLSHITMTDNTQTTDKILNITSDADIYIICVKDEAIELLAKDIRLKDKLIVHTSGTTSMNLLNNCSSNVGIFYPLQSFSKNLIIDFRRIPLLIEASNNESLEVLKSFASSISDTVVEMTEAERIHIHIGGVLVNNFTNHLFSLADQYLSTHRINFSLLKPLIAQTVEKLNFGKPSEMQTGPAIREDHKTMDSHMKLLTVQNELLAKIYGLMSESIVQSMV
jgi:predicted short-subunit dehydrogenase-like oxidoreductase (DUF2520 family)